MTPAKFLFVLVLDSAFATLVVLFTGVLSMGRDEADATASNLAITP